MKINDIKPYGLYNNVKPNTLQKTSQNILRASGNASQDTVEFSGNSVSLGKEYRGLKTQMSGEIMKSASSERIEALKNSVANGTYSVDSSKVAAAMISYIV